MFPFAFMFLFMLAFMAPGVVVLVVAVFVVVVLVVPVAVFLFVVFVLVVFVLSPPPQPLQRTATVRKTSRAKVRRIEFPPCPTGHIMELRGHSRAVGRSGSRHNSVSLATWRHQTLSSPAATLN